MAARTPRRWPRSARDARIRPGMAPGLVSGVSSVHLMQVRDADGPAVAAICARRRIRRAATHFTFGPCVPCRLGLPRHEASRGDLGARRPRCECEGRCRAYGCRLRHGDCGLRAAVSTGSAEVGRLRCPPPRSGPAATVTGAGTTRSSARRSTGRIDGPSTDQAGRVPSVRVRSVASPLRTTVMVSCSSGGYCVRMSSSVCRASMRWSLMAVMMSPSRTPA